MRKTIYFDKYWDETWPDPGELERYFLGPPGRQWFYANGNDSAGLNVEGC